MKAVDESARCNDCSWTDAAEGARIRAGRHYRETGHEVVTEATTTYVRETADPNQSTIFDFLDGEAA